MDEIWKDIKGFEGYYQVSNLGNVKSLKRKWQIEELLLKQCKLKNGYLTVGLNKLGEGERYYVHRLVAEAFLEIPEELRKYAGTRKLQVNHKNEVKTDNRAENLEWMSAKDNINYGSHNERKVVKQSKKVYQYTLDGQLVKVWSSASECRRNGFNNVSRCCIDNSKTNKGFKWSYEPI